MASDAISEFNRSFGFPDEDVDEISGVLSAMTTSDSA